MILHAFSVLVLSLGEALEILEVYMFGKRTLYGRNRPMVTERLEGLAHKRCQCGNCKQWIKEGSAYIYYIDASTRRVVSRLCSVTCEASYQRDARRKPRGFNTWT